MKANNPSPSPSNNTNTFNNRVAQFEQDQKKTIPAPAKTSKTKSSSKKGEDSFQLLLEARVKVMAAYSDEDRTAILKMEKTGQTNCREYDRYVRDVILAVGDVPTHTLRNCTEECGCFSCRGRLEAKKPKK